MHLRKREFSNFIFFPIFSHLDGPVPLWMFPSQPGNAKHCQAYGDLSRVWGLCAVGLKYVYLAVGMACMLKWDIKSILFVQYTKLLMVIFIT